jgi:diadenosine tetraphosphate (Ap4A) HIT family hydrolase
MIKLHPQLEKDCVILGEFSLCALLLLNDANYPWFILLPQRENMTEIYKLDPLDQQRLLNESAFFSQCLEDLFQPDKLNIAALGNVVPQLHIHHIARFKTDASWPAPVWGAVKPIPYKPEQIKHLSSRLFDWFDNHTEQVFRPLLSIDIQ